MSLQASSGAHAPIENKDQLAAYFEQGCKPEAQWRIGTEHEKFVYCRTTLGPVGYDGENGIRAILERLSQLTGWTPVMEGDHPIGLKAPDGASVSLEPGGQFELSGAPLEDVHHTCREVHAHLDAIKKVAEGTGVGFFGAGFTPCWTREEMPQMPKGRYGIMRRYMPKVGSLGLDMMHRTCTVQVNLDYGSEADMRAKFRTALALQPIATALFANSSIYEGKRSGYASYRAHIWTDTDPDRTGMLDFVFEDGFGFERYADYMLSVPMYFTYRNGRYLDAAGQSFADFLEGKLPAAPGEYPHMGDWEDHLSTAFPEVRMKRFLEMRGADSGAWSRICALPAFWVGLLYNAQALEAAWDLVKDWTAAQRAQLRLDAAKHGLQAQIAGRKVQDVALDALAIAHDGLKRRNRAGQIDPDETVFLDTLFEVAESGVTFGERMADHYENDLGSDMRRLLEEITF